MRFSTNLCAFAGNITATPELKMTPNGIAVCTFTLAVGREYNTKQEGEKITDFLSFVAWRGQAEYLCKYAHKGDTIFATGSLQTREYKDKEGNEKKIFEIICNGLHIVGSPNGKKDEENAPKTPAVPEQANMVKEQDGNFSAVSPESELPF